jgi:hypothetical protein
MREPPPELAEGDDREEDQPDDEHDRDDVLAFLGRRLFCGHDEGGEEVRHRAEMLLDPLAMKGQRARDRLDPGRFLREAGELRGIAPVAERCPGVGETIVVVAE